MNHAHSQPILVRAMKAVKLIFNSFWHLRMSITGGHGYIKLCYNDIRAKVQRTPKSLKWYLSTSLRSSIYIYIFSPCSERYSATMTS